VSIVPESVQVHSPDQVTDALSVAESAATNPEGRVFSLADVRPVPPFSNTGVQNTQTHTDPEPLEICFTASVDYLAFTCPVGVPVDNALSLLDGPFPLDWIPTERGANGYKKGFAAGDIRVFYDGNDDMGVFVSMKGRGCDQYANNQGWVTEEPWREFVSDILAINCSMTRFDLAYDDVGERVLYMEKVRTSIDEGRVVSKWKDCDPSGKRSLCEKAERKGDVVHFGSILSEVSGCIYDKAKEQIQKGRLLAGAHWIRCELRTKGDRANAMASAFVAEGFPAGVAVLRDYLDFKERSETDSNRSRWATCDWWEKFCSGVEKANLKVEKVLPTVDKVRSWLVKYVAPSLALVVDADDNSSDKMGGLALLASLVADGRKRFRQVHQNMLREYLGCNYASVSDGRYLYEWPDGQWRYKAPPGAVPGFVEQEVGGGVYKTGLPNPVCSRPVPLPPEIPAGSFPIAFAGGAA
jgi:phage replication initiation protein